MSRNLFGKSENFLSREYIFTTIVLIQALFGSKGLVGDVPKRAELLFSNPIARIVTLSMIAFTATKEIDTAIIVVCLFLALLWILRTPEERKRSKII